MNSPSCSSSFRCLALLSCLGLAVALPGADYKPTIDDGVTKTGDVMTYALPVAAMSVAAFLNDGEGAWQLTKSGLITMSLAVGLKYSVQARRPNGDPYSFPSGHAAISFVSAEYLRKRYGWSYGAPAYLAAVFVSYSRVRAHEHYLVDVAAGGAIGIVSTYLLTTPYLGWNIQPEWNAQRRGIRLSRTF